MRPFYRIPSRRLALIVRMCIVASTIAMPARLLPADYEDRYMSAEDLERLSIDEGLATEGQPLINRRCGTRSFAAGAQLLVILRGEAFRKGGQGTQFLSESDPSEQLHALETVQRHLLKPASRHGWRVTVVFDVFVNFTLLSARSVRETLCRLNPAAVRITQRRHASQQLSWLSSLSKFGSSPVWHAVLAMRVDLALKRDVAIASPRRLGSVADPVTVPFAICHRCDGSAGEVASTVPRVSDVMMFIPRSRYMDVVMALYRHAGCPWWIGLHNLASWLRGGVEFFVRDSRHDSDSSKQWNPLYRIIGREEAPQELAASTCFPCHTPEQAQYQEEVCFKSPTISPRDQWHLFVNSLGDGHTHPWEPSNHSTASNARSLDL